MIIKEVEEKTGLSRSNIRFYEKEKLIAPDRNVNNGYREAKKSGMKELRKQVINLVPICIFIC